jgi:hypothetical protein
MSHFRRLYVSISCLLVLIALTVVGAANAQQTLGSINGTVLDASGAAVPGSTVTVTDADINVTRTTKASNNGYFQVFNLPVGTYKVTATHDGFDTTQLSGISVKEAQASTLNVSLKVGQATTSVDVTANPMLNATDATNGYTMDAEQIALTPLATGSFTQLATLSPGVNAELLSGLDTNAGLGNQPIWANGQRDTSNTFQVNGVDVTNLFNGKSSSSTTSQRYNFNIGAGGSSTSSAGGGTIGGAAQTGSSVYGSNGNSLPSPPPEFLQELRVNTSLYDAQQGATSGAQIDANTLSGTNSIHGQVYGSYADNYANADPFFFKQAYLLTQQQNVGSFPGRLANPQLHRWTTGASFGGPIKKDKLFFFIGYQHLYASDESTAISQFNVPTGLTNDRSTAGIIAAATSYQQGAYTPPATGLAPQAVDLLNAKLPNGQYVIPSSQTPVSQPYLYGVPNVTLVGVSVLTGDNATMSLDYDLTKTDRLSFKYYYQNDPETKPYAYSQTGGFPTTTSNGAQVGEIDNTISIGSRFNWEQRLGYVRMHTYSYYNQQFGDTNTPSTGANFGIGNPPSGGPDVLPGMLISSFAINVANSSPGLKMGPYSVFANTGYYQNRLNPSTNAIFVLGKHTLVAGGGYSYTQLNIRNNRNGLGFVTASSFTNFLAGTTSGASYLNTTDSVTGRNNADRYYRTNEIDGYLQDKWQALSNLSITAGVRYDYHGGLTEKYGNIFNFDPSAYSVSGTDPAVGGTGFTVNGIAGSGFVFAGNSPSATPGTTDSTLTGRQWGFSPRVGFAFSPKANGGSVVFRGAAGIYYDRGELFSYLSPPAGSAVGGPFGVTEESPLVSYVKAGKSSKGVNGLNAPYSYSVVASPPVPGSNASAPYTALQTQLNTMTGTTAGEGLTCGAANGQENGSCPTPLDFGAYDKNNVLPYTINFGLSMQWQPRSDMAITIGYAGNRGRHAVIPIPFNEPQEATATTPALIGGAFPHSSNETTSYGEQVLNATAPPADADGSFAAIAGEPWATYDGGNTDFRAPYVGYSPYSALFKTVGNSAYDALQTQLEKRLTHNVQAGVSYTWSHSLDEQSDLGIFFTGNDPAHLKNSYASSDFDRTHVLSANFMVLVPNFAAKHSFTSYFVNDWSMTGIGVVQSGEPYSLNEFHGAVGSAQFGYYPSLINPVLPIKNPANVKSAMTGNPGSFRGVGGNYIPTLDPTQLAIVYLQPGQKGVPVSTGTDPQDVYETDFSPINQRNIFRQAGQKRLDLSFRKTVRITDRIGLQYSFNVFNVTNTTSLDVPQNSPQIRQGGACQSSLLTTAYDCEASHFYEGYGNIVTSQADQAASVSTGAPGGGTAGQNLDLTPYSTGSGKSTQLPITIPPLNNGCIASKEVNGNGCANNNANFGSVTGTIGGNRAITMGLHITY